MIKLPEPVGYTDKHGHTYAIKWSGALPANLTLYSDAQLKQAVRDALTLLIQRLNSNTYNLTKAECLDEIRALIKEIDAPKPEDYPEAYDERFSL